MEARFAHARDGSVALHVGIKCPAWCVAVSVQAVVGMEVCRVGWAVRGAVAGRCYKAVACLGNGTNFSFCWLLFIDSGVRQGESPGPEDGTSTLIDPYVRSAAKFQFVRGSAVAESVVCARGVGVAVVFRFEGAATHAASCEVGKPVSVE